MENLNEKKRTKFTQSITFKAIVIAVLILVMLIPKAMIMNLIWERSDRQQETVRKINDKWSDKQQLNGPFLTIPYNVIKVDDKGLKTTEHFRLCIAPEELTIKTVLYPEERYYGIYKTIVYRSKSVIKGYFKSVQEVMDSKGEWSFKGSTITLGVSDLRGVNNNVSMLIAETTFSPQAGSLQNDYGEALLFDIGSLELSIAEENIPFECELHLNGSSSINFVPTGKNTTVNISGAWTDPGFIGSFTPDYTIDENGFDASWSILHFNRNIPDTWDISRKINFSESSFGVDLFSKVDLYQLNTRSVKYAIMFIALTFLVFFLVEIITKERIHPIQYLLVGFALTIFYVLLLSISEWLTFNIAYLIAAIATISLVTLYVKTVFKSIKKTLLITTLLTVLYLFLFLTLKLEDIALLTGSIGLFIILGISMYSVRKINWYKE